VRIEKLSTANESAALEFLERRPYERVVIAHLVMYGSPHARNSIGVAVDASGVRGVGYFGNEILLSGDEATAQAFADYAAGLRRNGQRMIVGPQATVASFWPRIATGRKPPRIVRERQLVMRVERESLRSSPPAGARSTSAIGRSLDRRRKFGADDRRRARLRSAQSTDRVRGRH
jgi:hypothetical protein